MNKIPKIATSSYLNGKEEEISATKIVKTAGYVARHRKFGSYEDIQSKINNISGRTKQLFINTLRTAMNRYTTLSSTEIERYINDNF